MPLPRGRISINSLLILVALYLAVVQNQSFWRQVLLVLPAEHGVQEYRLLACLFVGLNVLLLLVMALLSARVLVKPVLIFLLIVAAVCSYFMDSFGVVIDQSMILNAVQTDAREAGELLRPAMALHVLITGFLPAFLVARVELLSGSRLRETLRRIVLLIVALSTLTACLLTNYKDVSLWARTNRHVRTYVNPTYPLHAVSRTIKTAYKSPDGPVAPIAPDAVRAPSASAKPRVVVMVVGETARAANFQLAGYARATNPELSAIDGVVSFSQMWSCGTATAISVPCMFSRLGRSRFSRSRARDEENLLDVLKRTGVDVLWRDNNSDSKGVATRVAYEDDRALKIDGLCDAEGCHDEVLLHGLDELLASGTEDRFIVLHLLGSHGPSYYKRYPPAFKKFEPECAQDDVQDCSRQAIVNAYDNSMLYTDHVLAQLIALLQRHQDRIEPAMLYLSDHGESLGENGLYLHGLPYAVAPDDQKHVPFVFWSPEHDLGCLRARAAQPYSQDNLFHTVLGLFAISTQEYQPKRDIAGACLARMPGSAD